MGSKIALDTNIFIYALEGKGELGNSARALFARIKRKNLQVFTSVLTIQEVFVGVYKEGLEDKIPNYLEFILGGGLITVVDVNREIAILAAKIRAEHKNMHNIKNIRTPDAIQLATAIYAGAREFITADRQLPKKIDGLNIKILR